MIKINLLPQRKVKRPQAEPGSQQFLIGVLAILGAGFAVWFFVDRGKRAELNELKDNSAQLQTQIAARAPDLVGYDEMKTAVDEAGKRASSINRLIAAKVVPANVLHELGEILTPGHPPTMTEVMTGLTSKGGDPNKEYQDDWDASHVWLSAFVDEGGTFKLEGGAQTEADVTQLSKRLAASAYFMDVNPAGGEKVADAQSGLTYYKFTITGKIAY
ncbi:MAG TPA: PilN domain-containing protein [Kofleriaceae bacterium]